MLAVQDAVAKFRAAARMRDQLDTQFVLIARTDALGAPNGTLDDAINRCKAYLGAGADVAFVEGPRTIDEIRRIVQEVGGPVLYNQAGVSPRLTTDQLRDLGVAIVLFPGAMIRAGLYAMHDYASALRTQGGLADVQFAQNMQAHPMSNLHVFAGLNQVQQFEQEFRAQ